MHTHVTSLDERNIIWEIERLESLLNSRVEEYKIFGKTGEDTEYDKKLKQKIHNLKVQLKEMGHSPSNT